MSDDLRTEIPEIVADVKKEIAQIGTDHKKAVERLEKTYEDFKKEHTEALKNGTTELGEVKEKLNKFTEDISTRVEEMSTKANERIDDMETRMNRSPFGAVGGEDLKELADEARQFKARQLSMRAPDFNLTDLADVNVSDFADYTKAWNRYLRKGHEAGMGMTPDQIKALQSGVDPSGGYIIRPALSNRVLTVLRESTPMRALATIETIGTDTLQFDTDINDMGANWVGETGTRSETTTANLGMHEIVTHEISAVPKATQKNLDDSAWDIEAWLERKLADKFGRTEANAFVVGNGVAKPRGFTTYSNGTTWGTIEQISSGAVYSATPCYTYTALVGTMTALKEKYLANAIWLASRISVKHLLLIVDGVGQYIFAPTLAGGPGGTRIFSPNLLGFSMRLASDMPAIAANSLSIAFGDFRQGYTIVDRMGMRILRNPYKSAPWVLFETFKRVGGDVTNFEAIKLINVDAS